MSLPKIYISPEGRVSVAPFEGATEVDLSRVQAGHKKEVFDVYPSGEWDKSTTIQWDGEVFILSTISENRRNGFVTKELRKLLPPTAEELKELKEKR